VLSYPPVTPKLSPQREYQLRQARKRAGLPESPVLSPEARKKRLEGFRESLRRSAALDYLVTDACTGEHLGFPSISLIEAHLKLASIGPEWPAVALLAYRCGDQSGKNMLWQPGCPRAIPTGRAVQLLQVGKE